VRLLQDLVPDEAADALQPVEDRFSGSLF